MDELSKSVPGAEGMVEAEQGTSRKSGNEFCLNCGTKLLDTFCQHCGQKDIPQRQTLGELWDNFISSFWSYEGKFFRTTKFLVIKPGFLAIEYNKGHRESYYHPARMYAFISFVFFLVLFSLPDSEVELDEEDKKELAEESRREKKRKMQDSVYTAFTTHEGDSTLRLLFSESFIDSLKKVKEKRAKRAKNGDGYSISDKYSTIGEYDSIQRAKPEEKRDGWFAKKLNIRIIELNKRYGEKDFGKEFVKAFMDNFSKMLFFLLPFFALVLKLLYIRRDYFYSEHLVFSIYYYNFGYLAGSLQLITNQFAWLDWLSTIIEFWIFFYLLFAMKRMYNQSWMKTIAKFSLFVGMFFMLSVLFLAVAAVIVLMVM